MMITIDIRQLPPPRRGRCHYADDAIDAALLAASFVTRVDISGGVCFAAAAL